MWIAGTPTDPGWYVLQFPEGDRFVVVRVFYEENTFRMEDANYGGYVTDTNTHYFPIPQPNLLAS